MFDKLFIKMNLNKFIKNNKEEFTFNDVYKVIKPKDVFDLAEILSNYVIKNKLKISIKIESPLSNQIYYYNSILEVTDTILDDNKQEYFRVLPEDCIIIYKKI